MPLPTALPLRWTNGTYRETRALRTTVRAAEDGTEQRAARRMRPMRRHRFHTTLLDARDAGILTALVHGLLGTEDVAVPFWPHTTVLTGAAGAGAGTLNCDPTERDFYAGQYALLYRSASAYELVEILTVGGSSLTLNGTTVSAWAIGTMIIPAHRGRLPAQQRVPWQTPWATDALELDVELDPLGLPAVTGSPGATPAVFTVGLQPDFSGPLDELHEIAVDRFENPTGWRDDRTSWAAPRMAWTDARQLRSRADVRSLWTWYGSVLGRLTPSWVPAFRDALDLVVAVAPADPDLTIRTIGYTDLLFPEEGWRHLALITPAGAITHRRVTAAVDNLDGTETLTLDAVAGATVPLQGLVTVLRYARLAEDPVTVEWEHPELARTQLGWMELPLEVPATV